MFYQMQEGYISLDGPWEDRSVNVLVPGHLSPKGVNLVVARDTLPLKMEFDDYLDQQKKTFAGELPKFKPGQHTVEVIDQRPAHILEFSWDNSGSPMHQIMGIIHDKERVVTLTATIPGDIDQTTRETLLSVMKGYKFGAAPPPEGTAS